MILPDYLRSRFVQAALSYIGCNSEGEFVCRGSDCWCQCHAEFPHCNCPEVDLRAMENNLLLIKEAWVLANKDFEESGVKMVITVRIMMMMVMILQAGPSLRARSVP